MSRSPVFSLLRRALRRIRKPAARPTSPLMSRRALLQTGAVAGAGLLLPHIAAARPRRAGTQPRIVILGAGIAGLNAAWTLKNAGFEADIYEVNKRAGGRIMTAQNIVGKGISSELGGEFIDSNHTDMLALVREFNLEMNDFISPPESELGDCYLFGSKVYSENDIIRASAPYSDKLDAIAEKVRGNAAARTEYDQKSIADILRIIGVKGWLYSLFNTAYTTEYGLDIDRLSALLITDILPQTTSSHIEFFGESDERYTIKGGNAKLTEALSSALGERIHYQNMATGIEQKGGSYLVHMENESASGDKIPADFVICTLPFTVVRAMILKVEGMHPLQQRAIKELSYGTNSKFIAGFKRPIWRDRRKSGMLFSDGDLQVAWDSSRGQGAEGGALTFFYGGKRGVELVNFTDAEILGGATKRIERLFPGITAAHTGESNQFVWAKNRFVLGSYSCYTSGQQTAFGGYEGMNAGNLYFAGEHCSRRFQGYMNGAAETGRTAAEAIIAKLK
ncbi:MAG: NAD(P)/FAD-dependent oxidoreductase [Candidatus Kapabacteria bacterium]|nr:NAD(P)/FAD-dependent oxidoreductase [Candidatus Kapabacteria bacterium]